jgi:hypothetical protein
MFYRVENPSCVHYMKQLQIVVTGSRGKSSVVRLLFYALSACGIKTWARITGVIPRELSPGGEKTILRSAGGHVEEMKWWLRVIPVDAEAVVLENSAVAPDLQELPSKWLKDSIFVITNVRPDHQDAWGPGEEGAVGAIMRGIPQRSTVFIPETTASSLALLDGLEKKQCKVHVAPLSSKGYSVWREENMAVVREILNFMGLDSKKGEDAASSLVSDVADFQVIPLGDSELAAAFSANDLATTKLLFASLEWKMEETTILFNSRRDRPERLKAFLPWLRQPGWKRVLFMGARLLYPRKGIKYISISSIADVEELLKREKKVFGCGNVAGMPLAFLIDYALKGGNHA